MAPDGKRHDARLASYYCTTVHVLHSVVLNGVDNGAAILYRMIPSEVEQKFLVPVPVETGVAVTAYSLQGPVLQSEATNPNRYPDFVHHPSPGQAKIPSTMAACSGEEKLTPRGSGPTAVKLFANPLLGYVTA
jgi:hypothetical protein